MVHSSTGRVEDLDRVREVIMVMVMVTHLAPVIHGDSDTR